MPNRTSYWLLVREGQTGTEVLDTRLSGGEKALPVFSFEEEAEMFLCLRGPREDWRVEEIAVEDILAMVHAALDDIGYVTLDPIPEGSCLNTTGLLSISLKDFVESLNKSTPRGVLPGKWVTLSPALEHGLG
ncbi:MAG: hypothetical protein WA990_07885 [Rubrobacteraceae bacterium]